MATALPASPTLLRPRPAKVLTARRQAPARLVLPRCQVTAQTAPAVTRQERHKVPLELEEVGLPINTYGPKEPFIGKIVSVKTLTGPRASGEVCHITIQTDGKIPFVEGQCYGVQPPGTKVNAKGKEVPHAMRLYTIASTRYGDAFDGKTASLCVRRAIYVDPETKEQDPPKKGICSNFLCNAKPGQEITMTGPSGKVLLLPDDPSANIIMVATGSGIAPFRAFWRRMFLEDVPGYRFQGNAWLFMGAANADGTLYDDELQEIMAAHPDQFRLSYALSREGPKNKKGGKMYIQDRVEEHADGVFELLHHGAHIYFCGLKGMMPGIMEMLERVSGEKGLVWADFFEGLKQRNQIHIEVY